MKLTNQKADELSKFAESSNEVELIVNDHRRAILPDGTSYSAQKLELRFRHRGGKPPDQWEYFLLSFDIESENDDIPVAPV